jgi:hexokinase
MICFRRKQAFEKMISGMYLGEIVRNVLLYLIDQPPVPATATTPAQYHLFNGYSCKVLDTHYGLDTAFMSAIAEASSSEEAHALVAKTFGFEASQITLADAEVRPNSFL